MCVERVQSFWYGKDLPTFARLCMASFLDYGHRYRLYVYRRPDNVPFGVDLHDASEILPESEVFYYKNPDGSNRSVAAFANLFRYALLRARGGWWVDTDVLRTDGVFPRDELLLGWEDDERICNAILRAPQGHALIAEAERRALAAGTELEWGQTGPALVTALVSEMGLGGAVRALGDLYPTRPDEFRLPTMAEGRDESERRAQATPLFHLWHEMFRIEGDRRLNSPEPGSFLAERYARHGVFPKF